MTTQVRLDRINDFTLRQVFDFIKNHLLKQGKAAKMRLSGNAPIDGCVYRTPEGLSCAVGCMVPDEAVSKMNDLGLNEGTGFDDLIYGMQWDFPKDDKVADLLADIQELHDTISPEYWDHDLDNLEKAYFGEDRS